MLHSLSHTSHTRSYSHVSACSPSHTNSGGLLLSHLPSISHTHKEVGTPPLTVTHTQTEGRTPSHSHLPHRESGGGVRLIHHYTHVHSHTMEDLLTYSNAISHREEDTLTLPLTQNGGDTHSRSHTHTESTAHSFTHTHTHLP